MATDGLKIAWKVAKLAHKVYQACQQAEDNRENLADLSTYLFSVHHCLNSLRDDVLHNRNVCDTLEAVEKTLKKTELFIQSEQRGFETNGKLKRKLRALFKAKTQAERISTLHEELQSRLQQLTALTTTNCQGLLNQLGDKFCEMQNNLYGHQHEFRDQMLRILEMQAKKMERMEAAVQNMCEAERDRHVVDVLRESVDAVEGVLRQNRHLSSSVSTPPGTSSAAGGLPSDLGSRRAWRQRGIHFINSDQLVLEEKIGAGGYGEVFRAKWLREPVAVKKLPTGRLDGNMLTRVMEEAKLHNILRGKYLVEMKGISLPEDKECDPWIVMELMDMGLDEFLNEQYDELHPAALLDIALQISTALESLHSLYNVLHCDLKAANVLMKRDAQCKFGWRAKLSDFGMSEARETVSMSIRTSGIIPQAGSVGAVGTPTTMGPEVMMRQGYGRSSDMYSFGVVLYEIVTGELAWERVPRAEAVRQAVLRGDRPRVPAENPWRGVVEDGVWGDVCELISRCWAAEPGDRPSFPSVSAQLREMMGRALRELGVVENTPVERGIDGVPEHIRTIVEQLRVGTVAEQERAAKRLRVLLRDDSNSRSVVAAAGAVEPLVELLRSGTDGVKEKAAGALWNLAGGNAENKVSIAAEGAVEPLVELLRSGTDGAKEQAAGALRSLASGNAENKVSIAAAGALEPLVELLRSGTDGVKEKAVGALWNLAGGNAENKVSIAAEGAVEPLVELLRSGTDGAKEQAAGALRSLASGNAENQDSVVAAGAIEAFMQLLHRGPQNVKTAASQAISVLSFNPSVRDIIRACGGLEALEHLRAKGNVDQKKYVTRALNLY